MTDIQYSRLFLHLLPFFLLPQFLNIFIFIITIYSFYYIGCLLQYLLTEPTSPRSADEDHFSPLGLEGLR